MSNDPILDEVELGFPWKTFDPFLFCVFHEDAYPMGNEEMGPEASLVGRDLGQDFAGIDGWRMYHGRKIPGFPSHPHRGFETVTIVRDGIIDHSDSLGATARFGAGDVQWLTAGKGIVHAEMFPMIHRDKPNPLELFQIWLNLPAKDKFVDPYFSMLWRPMIPVVERRDAQGKSTRINVIAGGIEGVRAPAPPPNSWASRAKAELAIWTMKLESEARFQLPATSPGVHRTIYVFRGDELMVGPRRVRRGRAVKTRGEFALELHNPGPAVEILVLQGRPIGEPVAQYGPFVMNTQREIQEAFADYRKTQFGGWPWPSEAPVHARDAGRHALHPDGRTETPES